MSERSGDDEETEEERHSSSEQESVGDEQRLLEDGGEPEEDDRQSSASEANAAPQERDELINPHWAESRDLGSGAIVPLPPEENQFFQVRMCATVQIFLVSSALRCCWRRASN